MKEVYPINFDPFFFGILNFHCICLIRFLGGWSEIREREKETKTSCWVEMVKGARGGEKNLRIKPIFLISEE